jgi:probable rRNA maturation factor
MTEIINQQDKIRIELNQFNSFANLVLDEIANGKTTTIAFVSDKKMSELNNQFRGKNKTTDVLSFPFENDFDSNENFLGDIVISLEQAERQAAENNLTLENEVQQLILHGILHLLGYDHETDNGEMNLYELQLREKFSV